MHRSPEVELHRFLRSQRALTAQLVAADSLDEVAPGFAATVAELLGWRAGAIREAPEPGVSLPGRAWETGEIVWTAEGEIALPVPVGAPEDVRAVAEFHADSFEPPSDDLLDILATFADQLGVFIERRGAEAKLHSKIGEHAEAERVRHHFAEVVRGSQDAVLSKDLEGIITSWNPAAEGLYGYTQAEAIGQHISFLVPPDHHGEEQVILDKIRRGERIETYETERIRKDGARVDVSLTVSPIEQPILGIVGASVIARDITAEKRRRRAQEFLVAATRGLDASLDLTETARTIVATAVPELAAVCVMDFVRRDGQIGDSVVAAADPDVAARLERIRKEVPLDPAGDHPVAQVLREARPMVWRDLTSPAVVDQVAQTEEHRRLMSDAGYNSAAVVALIARGRTLGALSFLHATTDLRYDAADLELLSELADRAAIALDNARLYQERDRLARNLQRGLRPPQPAEVPGLEISVVFEAAGEGIDVGGDLYDVLPTDDGCWILIGDVAGKGSAAAAISVALRHAVRGLTREIEDPGEVLSRVNELLLEGTSLNDFATAMLLRMRSGPSGWRATLAAAGHPPAIHVKQEGSAQLGGGTILGAFDDAGLATHEAVFEEGDTLVLCTDGWLEIGPPQTHLEPQALAELVDVLSSLELDELTARLRHDAVSRGDGTLRDDMVVLAVRPAGGSPGRRGADSGQIAQPSPQ